MFNISIKKFKKYKKKIKLEALRKNILKNKGKLGENSIQAQDSLVGIHKEKNDRQKKTYNQCKALSVKGKGLSQKTFHKIKKYF